METFIYSELKKASIFKDESRIPTLGPYAAALSFVIGNANKSRLKNDPIFRARYQDLTVYRGLKLDMVNFNLQFKGIEPNYRVHTPDNNTDEYIAGLKTWTS